MNFSENAFAVTGRPARDLESRLFRIAVIISDQPKIPLNPFHDAQDALPLISEGDFQQQSSGIGSDCYKQNRPVCLPLIENQQTQNGTDDCDIDKNEQSTAANLPD